MSSKGDHSPGKSSHVGPSATSPSTGPAVSPKFAVSGETAGSVNESGSAPQVAGHQEFVDAVWPLMMRSVEEKMVHMEQEMIKRHNIKMMNEMQEVVRQIKLAKTKNDETLRDYQKKQTDLTRSVLEIAEKYAAMRGELDEIKRQAVINKQQLTHRCDQTTDQVAQLKHAVFTAWQKEKAEIQQKVSQSFRGDLALVLGQFDAKLKDSFSETSKLRFEVKQLTARMNGEDPNSVQPEVPSYVDTAVAAVSSLPPVDSTAAAPAEDSSASPPGLSSATGGVNMSSLTQNLAAFIAKQQQTSGGAPPQVNVAMLQQFMQTLPRQQQLQLQMLLQQHRQGQTGVPTAAAAAGGTPSVPPGLGLSGPSVSPQAVTPPPVSASGVSGPGATMIQSLAQQLQLQVNAAQQKASASGPGSVNCPFFAMFGWCKFGERCRYLHQPTGKEPLRNLPQSVIQTLQTQLASGSTAETTQTLMTALAGLAAKQNATSAPPAGLGGAPAGSAGQGGPSLSAAVGNSGGGNAVQQAMISAQIQAQQEAATMGAARAKAMPCRFHAIGRCAYGDRCAYSHSLGGAAGTSTGAVAGAVAAAWGKTDLSQASWGGAMNASPPEAGNDNSGLIMDGEDDTNYDQWNAMTFEDEPAPPGL